MQADQPLESSTNQLTTTIYVDSQEKAPLALFSCICYQGRNFSRADAKVEITVKVYRSFAKIRIEFLQISEEEQLGIQSMFSYSELGEGVTINPVVKIRPLFREGLSESENREIASNDNTDAIFPLVKEFKYKKPSVSLSSQADLSAYEQTYQFGLQALRKNFPNAGKPADEKV